MTKIQKPQLISHMMVSQDLDYEHAEQFVSEFCNYIKTEVSRGNSVYLYQFGIFTASKRNAKVGRNPSTGKQIINPPHYAPRFKASLDFRRQLRKAHPKS